MTKVKKTFQIYNKGGPIKNFSVRWKYGKPEWGDVTVNSPTSNSFPKEVTVEIDPQNISNYDTEISEELEIRIDNNTTSIPVSFTKKKPITKEILEGLVVFFEFLVTVLGVTYEIVKFLIIFSPMILFLVFVVWFISLLFS